MKLSELKNGQSAIIMKVNGYGGFRKRIMEMGFVKGKTVVPVLNAPLNDPIKYNIMGYEVSLRRSEAAMIEVYPENEEENPGGIAGKPADSGTTENENAEDENAERNYIRTGKNISIALVGNPNCGKTSLFNHLSGGHEHVGNYSGVTVESKNGSFKYKGYRFTVTDLPGTYALSAYSPEELYVRKHIVEQDPDVIINVVAASNIERNLYLTTELIDISHSMVIALNMYDELEASGARLDYDQLGRMLGVPAIPVVAKNGKGLEELLDTVINVYEGKDQRVRHIHINHSAVIEQEIKNISSEMKASEELPKYFPPRYWTIKLLEKDKEVEKLLSPCKSYPKWKEMASKASKNAERLLNEDIETALTDEKYGFISGALQETYTPAKQARNKKDSLIDRIVTDRWFGFPIFLLLMWLMFWATFNIGAYPQAWIESGIAWLGGWLSGIMSDGMLKDLLVDGIIGGVGSVLVFLPQILILYLFISLMEDSGYMARAAFIMDKLMHKMGLHGKSFIPLLMGFGCNVPAIMATRTIESRSSRLITILINPFMSCSARLPVFIVLAGTFFPKHAGTALFLLYLLGAAVAVITAKLLRKFIFGKDETPFVMELPPYRIPTAAATLRHMWDRSEQYLKKIGGVILIASIAVWFLSYFPREASPTDGTGTETGHYSYLDRLGRGIEPVLKPLGLNWKAGVALVAGIPAKEVVASTLGVLYNSEEEGEGLSEKLASSGDFTLPSAVAFMIFILLYCPCIATVSAIANEAGSWKWGAFSVLYNTVIAWIVAFIGMLVTSLII